MERWADEAARILDRAMESGKTELYEVIRKATGFMVLTRLVDNLPVRDHRPKQPHHAVPATPTSIASRKSAEPVSGHRSPRTFRKTWGTTHRDKARQVDNVCPEHSGNSPGGLHRKYRDEPPGGIWSGAPGLGQRPRDGHGGYSGSARHPLLHRRGYRRRKLLEPDSHILQLEQPGRGSGAPGGVPASSKMAAWISNK